MMRGRDERLNADLILEIQNEIKAKREFEKGQPYEHLLLEILLDMITARIDSEYHEYSKVVKSLTRDSDLGINENHLHELLQTNHKYFLKLIKRLNKLLTFVNELFNSLETLLQNDEDMANMYLTDKSHNTPRQKESHDEVEVLLETYVSQFEDYQNRIKELIFGIKSTQDFLNITLDTVRNRMMQVELVMGVAAFSVSIATFLVGVFGMNLVSHLEQNPTMFYWISGVAISFATFIFSLILKICKKKGIFKTTISKNYFLEKKKK